MLTSMLRNRPPSVDSVLQSSLVVKCKYSIPKYFNSLTFLFLASSTIHSGEKQTTSQEGLEPTVHEPCMCLDTDLFR